MSKRLMYIEHDVYKPQFSVSFHRLPVCSDVGSQYRRHVTHERPATDVTIAFVVSVGNAEKS